MQSAEHVSLIPGLSRRTVYELETLGVRKWRDLLRTDEAALASLSFASSERDPWKRGARQLEKTGLALRLPLQVDAFKDWTVLGLDYRREGEQLLPMRIWHEEDGTIREARLEPTDLARLTKRPTLAFYGETDHKHFLDVVHHALPGYRPACLNVISLLEEVVHAPLLNLELAFVLDFLGLPKVDGTAGVARVQAARQILTRLSEASAA
jgi:hypothetical protein